MRSNQYASVCTVCKSAEDSAKFSKAPKPLPTRIGESLAMDLLARAAILGGWRLPGERGEFFQRGHTAKRTNEPLDASQFRPSRTWRHRVERSTATYVLTRWAARWQNQAQTTGLGWLQLRERDIRDSFVNRNDLEIKKAYELKISSFLQLFHIRN